MTKRTIILCYRKIINLNSIAPWEKLIFEDSYAEFKMQSQLFNQEKTHRTFAELLQGDSQAKQLHFLVSASVVNYLRQLNNTIPDILNNLGQHFLKFSKYQFEIINSDLQDKTKHQVAVNFFSEPLLWLDTIGNYLLVADTVAEEEENLLTNLFQLQPYLSIHSILKE